jgi:hypothetical protein
MPVRCLTVKVTDNARDLDPTLITSNSAPISGTERDAVMTTTHPIETPVALAGSFTFDSDIRTGPPPWFGSVDDAASW